MRLSRRSENWQIHKTHSQKTMIHPESAKDRQDLRLGRVVSKDSQAWKE